MSKYIEKIESLVLPVIPLRGMVAFPNIPINFELSRDISIKACNVALDSDMYVLLLAQRDPAVDDPTAADLFKTGCISKIRHTLKTPDGTLRVIAEGVCRGVISSVFESDGYLTAQVMSKIMTSEHSSSDIRAEALIREAGEVLRKMAEYMPSDGPDLNIAVKTVKSPGMFADLIASGDINVCFRCLYPQFFIRSVCSCCHFQILFFKGIKRFLFRTGQRLDPPGKFGQDV